MPIVHRPSSIVRAIALALLVGALSVALACQLPARHAVDVGGYDAAYVQGFADAERAAEIPRPYLVGSDGSARWSGPSSALLFPQAGLPGSVTLRVSGWRASGPPPRLQLLLNGQTPLGSFTLGPGWQEQTVVIDGGLLKANDFFVELRADTATLDDGREVGVLLDRATYRVGPGPVVPYPAQVLYGALAAGLLWGLGIGDRGLGDRLRRALLFWLLVLIAWFFLYRTQPPFYPYPLPWLLPGIDLALAAALGLRLWRPALRSWLVARLWLLDLLALAGIALWAGAVWGAAQGHLTLARPGVENDFRVFATRDTLERIFQADGFYNLGYPLLLWLVRPLAADNAFLAARIIAVGSGALLLAGGYWLGRTLFAQQPPLARRTLALLALLALALSPLVVQYGLYIGSDGPFAALVTLSIALLVAGAGAERPRPALILLAGAVGGAAFLVRHLGLVLLPWGIIACWLLAKNQTHTGQSLPIKADRSPFVLRLPSFVLRLASFLLRLPSIVHRLSSIVYRPSSLFAAGFLLAMLPQLIVNTVQTGQPLYNQQAKNIWLCVYGSCDWGRWEEAPNSITLAEVVLRDPGRFLANWGGNLRAFVGTGGEDTSEFGRAIQLRLLAWPANWLAIVGVIGWMVGRRSGGAEERRSGGAEEQGRSDAPLPPCPPAPLLLLLLYVLAVCMAFALPRFFLPLAPIYALAAAWTCGAIYRRLRAATERWAAPLALAGCLLLGGMLWPGFGIGARYVLDGQPADEVAAILMVESALRPRERVLVCVPPDRPIGKYSAIAHRATLCPGDASGPAAVASASDAAYLLWSDARGEVPLPAAALVGRAGPYSLFHLP